MDAGRDWIQNAEGGISFTEEEEHFFHKTAGEEIMLVGREHRK